MLIDNSAWVRLNLGLVPSERAAEVAAMFVERAVEVCSPFMLEAGYSARNARDHDEAMDAFGRLPRREFDRRAEDRALDAQAQLARAGHHRLPIVNVMIAAIADRHEVGILHYDGDYDRILERTDLRFESVWSLPGAASTERRTGPHRRP